MTVLLRKRNLSTKKFFMKALDIQTETARLAHKESVVPKSYRFTFGVPMCETARSIVANIEYADASYPNTSWGVIERKKHLAMAIATIESTGLRATSCWWIFPNTSRASSMNTPRKYLRTSQTLASRSWAPIS